MFLNPDFNPATIQIQAFEPGRIQVNHQWQTTSLLLCADAMEPLKAPSLRALSISDYEKVFSWPVDIVLLGTGPEQHIPKPDLIASFYTRKMGIEFMNSYAACRTFSVLTSEQRRVAAIILIE